VHVVGLAEVSPAWSRLVSPDHPGRTPTPPPTLSVYVWPGHTLVVAAALLLVSVNRMPAVVPDGGLWPPMYAAVATSGWEMQDRPGGLVCPLPCGCRCRLTHIEGVAPAICRVCAVVTSAQGHSCTQSATIGCVGPHLKRQQRRRQRQQGAQRHQALLHRAGITAGGPRLSEIVSFTAPSLTSRIVRDGARCGCV
jgi:hypothetical protein